ILKISLAQKLCITEGIFTIVIGRCRYGREPRDSHYVITWLLRTPISPFQPLFSGRPLYHPRPDPLHMPSLRCPVRCICMMSSIASRLEDAPHSFTHAQASPTQSAHTMLAPWQVAKNVQDRRLRVVKCTHLLWTD